MIKKLLLVTTLSIATTTVANANADAEKLIQHGGMIWWVHNECLEHNIGLTDVAWNIKYTTDKFASHPKFIESEDLMIKLYNTAYDVDESGKFFCSSIQSQWPKYFIQN